MKIYLGLDCGSVSVKLACVDENKKLVAGVYLRNEGIIPTIKKGLEQIKGKVKDLEVAGACTTGSGREFTALFIGADIVKTEILAHCEATLYYYPNVRTIIDIGGEDCKLITLQDGIWTNYAMNSICGAGTGAVIEAIARTLDVPIEEVGDLALQSKNRLNFPGKCGILAQSAVVSKKNKGAEKSDILMGICRALINNYMTLAKNIPLEPPFIFQGATAQNKALVKALEEELNHKVIVPENCSLMGAIGASFLAMGVEKTKFKGFGIVNTDFKVKNFVCGDCSNNCEITQIIQANKTLGAIGSRCGKW